MVLQDLVLVVLGLAVYLVGGRLNHSIRDHIRDVGVPRVISALLCPQVDDTLTPSFFT